MEKMNNEKKRDNKKRGVENPMKLIFSSMSGVSI
jgi:hypothetical protein